MDCRQAASEDQGQGRWETRQITVSSVQSLAWPLAGLPARAPAKLCPWQDGAGNGARHHLFALLERNPQCARPETRAVVQLRTARTLAVTAYLGKMTRWCARQSASSLLHM